MQSVDASSLLRAKQILMASQVDIPVLDQDILDQAWEIDPCALASVDRPVTLNGTFSYPLSRSDADDISRQMGSVGGTASFNVEEVRTTFTVNLPQLLAATTVYSGKKNL